jgi:hypothetical protein
MFQTPWMSERLLDCGKEGNKLYSGGLISDVTYCFFFVGLPLDDLNVLQQYLPMDTCAMKLDLRPLGGLLHNSLQRPFLAISYTINSSRKAPKTGH